MANISLYTAASWSSFCSSSYDPHVYNRRMQTKSRRCLRNFANGELLFGMWPDGDVLQALVDNRCERAHPMTRWPTTCFKETIAIVDGFGSSPAN